MLFLDGILSTPYRGSLATVFRDMNLYRVVVKLITVVVVGTA